MYTHFNYNFFENTRNNMANNSKNQLGICICNPYMLKYIKYALTCTIKLNSFITISYEMDLCLT